jgi:asparagine synthase (glutamine-hydrolysing)
MCGIVALLNLDPAQAPHADLRRQVIAQAKKIRHRGPDWSGVFADERAILAHERLSIVDVEHGAQPLIDLRTGAALAVNGEIYNHKELRAGLKSDHAFQTSSDCEVILYLYEDEPPQKFL